MMKGVTSQQLRLLILLCIVIVLAGAIQIGNIYNNKVSVMESENENLENYILELDSKIVQEDFYRTTIEENKVKSQKILDLYGAGNTPEKSIMLMKELTEKADIEIPSIGFLGNTNIYSSSAYVTEEGLNIYAYEYPLSISYKTTYKGFKECMDFINKNKERMNVGSVTASYDSENGNLSGSMVINLYSVEGTKKIYEDPIVYGVNIGTKNIFGTSEVSPSISNQN